MNENHLFTQDMLTAIIIWAFVCSVLLVPVGLSLEKKHYKESTIDYITVEESMRHCRLAQRWNNFAAVNAFIFMGTSIYFIGMGVM